MKPSTSYIPFLSDCLGDGAGENERKIDSRVSYGFLGTQSRAPLSRTNNRIWMNEQQNPNEFPAHKNTKSQRMKKQTRQSKSNSRCTCVTVINYVTIHHLLPFHNLPVCVWKCISVLQLKRSHANGYYITIMACLSLASFVLHVKMLNKRDMDQPTCSRTNICGMLYVRTWTTFGLLSTTSNDILVIIQSKKNQDYQKPRTFPIQSSSSR